LLIEMIFFQKRKYPLPYYREHYFHDTPVTISRRHFMWW